jgi:RNA polymerase sigma factor (sigma-70 family)
MAVRDRGQHPQASLAHPRRCGPDPAVRRATVRDTTDSHEDHVVGRLDSADAWASVREVLDTLAEGDREAILLFAWEELSYPEIALAMDIPVGTVRSRIHRARAQLRDALGDTLEVPR